MIDLKLNNKVTDVYKENARFDALLQQFYATRDDTLIPQISEIVFNCSANVLKKRFGSWWDADFLLDRVLDMTTIIMNRIKNFKKWPNGYQIKNLPTVCRYAIFNIAQSDAVRNVEDELSLDEENVLIATDYATARAYEIAKYNNCSWEDEILDRIQENEVCKEY